MSKLKDIFSKAKAFFMESNRYKHFGYALAIGVLSNSWWCSLLAGSACGGGMELKDHLYGNKFDILDLAFTVAGSLVGYSIRALVALMIA